MEDPRDLSSVIDCKLPFNLLGNMHQRLSLQKVAKEVKGLGPSASGQHQERQFLLE